MSKKLLKIFFLLLFIYSSILIFLNIDKIKENIIDETPNNYENNNIPKNNEYTRNYKYSTYKNVNDISIHNEKDIINLFYTLLNKGVEQYTFYCPNDYEECANDVMKLSNDYDKLNIINNYLNPFNSYHSFNITITNNLEVLVEINKLYKDDEINKVKEKMQTIINKLNLNKNEYDLEDIKAIHNYLIKNISYDENYNIDYGITDSSKATGALFNSKSVCGGYADTFSLFMDYMNIPNFKVASENHIWNVIKIDNKWKHIDVTWDDDETNPNNINNFFMITTEELYELDTEKHTFNKDYYLELK